MTKSFRRFWIVASCRRGSTAVEFAMLMPIMMIVIFGIIVFGSYFAVVHGVQQLAADAARSSVAGLNNSERASLATDYVTSNAGSYPLVDVANLSVNAATSGALPNVFVVTVNYDASGMFIHSLPPILAPPATISRSAAIPFGGS